MTWSILENGFMNEAMFMKRTLRQAGSNLVLCCESKGVTVDYVKRVPIM
jgi:hypothetical protein